MSASCVSCKVSCGSIWQHEETLNSTAHARDGIENRCSGPCNFTDKDAFARKAGRLSGKLARLCWRHCRTRQWRQPGDEAQMRSARGRTQEVRCGCLSTTKKDAFARKFCRYSVKLERLRWRHCRTRQWRQTGSRGRSHSQHVVVQKK